MTTDTRTTVTITPLTGPDDVLYHHYPGQYAMQACYIDLDLRDGELSAWWNGEIGNAVPSDVWHGVVRRYNIPVLTPDTVNSVLEEIAPLAQIVLDHSSVEWDGSNHVARLDAEAQDAEARICGGETSTGEWIPGLLDQYDTAEVEIWDASEWLEPVLSDIREEMRAGRPLEQIIADWGDTSLSDARICVINGLEQYLTDMAVEIATEEED